MAATPRPPLTALALLSALGLTLGCKNDTEFIAQKKCLTTAPLVDAGLVAVGDRLTMSIQLKSECGAPVTVSDISLENEGGGEEFYLLTWDGGTGSLQLEGGTETVPGMAIVQVSFRPEAEGYFHSIMTITSNDTVVEERTDDGQGVWRLALRGMAQHPCGTIAPVVLDYGRKAMGGYFPGYVEVANCGRVTLTVAAFNVEGSSSFYVSTPDPVYVPPLDHETVEVGWIPGSTSAQSATITFVTNDPELDGTVKAFGNNCATSVETSWDQDHDGWFECGGDCNDADPLTNPSASERQNGVDDDCDDEVDEAANSVSRDNDGDGFTEEQGDCDDANIAVFPGTIEDVNQIDDDCNGSVDDATWYYDDDEDSFSEREGDCDDANAAIFPGATEDVDLVDNDCDGDVDEGGLDFDDDGDGFTDNGGDCDDGDPWAWPGATEDCDGDDNDCDTLTDEDGACGYLAEVTEDTGETTTSTGGGGTCTTSPSRAWPWLLLAALPLALRRRRSA